MEGIVRKSVLYRLFNHKNKLFPLGIHIAIAFVTVGGSLGAKFMALVVLVLGLYEIVRFKDESYLSLYWVAYSVSIEVLFRMTHGAITHEFGKYTVLIFFVAALVVSKRSLRSQDLLLVLYFLCLLPSVFLAEVPDGHNLRKSILFNISGPISLFIAGLYCNSVKLKRNEFKLLGLSLLYPTICFALAVFLKSPSLSEIEFTTQSNFQTSGGFGPNQVSTTLGFGVLILALMMFLKIRVTGYRWLDLAILLFMLFRGLLTFSRGGVISALVCLGGFMFLYQLLVRKNIKPVHLVSVFLLISVSYLVWIKANDLTGGMLENRYGNKNMKGRVKDDVSSGRLGIFEGELGAFSEHPIFGVGVGGGKFYRLNNGLEYAASHNEIGRMLSEHGVFGLFALLLLVILNARRFFKSKGIVKIWGVVWTVFFFLTLNHAAMRLAIPGFVFGLSRIKEIEWSESAES